MRLTVGSIAASIVMTAVLISYWPVGPMHLTQSMAQAQQTEKGKEIPASAPEKLDVNAQSETKLEKIIDAEFVDTPLSQLLDYLDEKTKVQFHMDTRVLTEAGITSDTTITFHLKNVPAEMVLRLIFRDLGLGYWLDNGVVIVSTKEEVESRFETHVYRVSDLIDPIANISSPYYSRPIVQNPPLSSEAKGANMPGRSFPAPYPLPVPASHLDELMGSIRDTIKRESWDSAGGPASICEYRGALIISQTAEVHRKIQKLLDDLRKSIDKSTPAVKADPEQPVSENRDQSPVR